MLHLFILVLAIALVWLWSAGEIGVALVGLAVGLVVVAVLVAVIAYARRLRAGATPASDAIRVRASLIRRDGRLGEAAAAYAEVGDAAGIRRVALDAAHDDRAAEALTDTAVAYFALRATITTARRLGVVPSSLLDRADASASAAAAQLWRSCDRLAVVGSSQSARIDAALRSYERAVAVVRADLESARDGIVQVAVGRVLEAQLADVASRLARLDRASKAVDEAIADAFA